MLTNFIAELKWRGMLHDVMPETEEHLLSEMRAAYMGIDPTADSLHIGHLVGVMLLKHFQIAGHKPYALIGGATGMIGDPSGKSNERNLLDEATLRHNQAALKEQLSRFLDFDSEVSNSAVLVNNYDWMKDFSFLSFIRDVGKHITVNYMMAKDSVKKRLSSEAAEGMSFTEFTYQLVQGYDFLYLYKNFQCTLQMGGSDQWGNITTGTELIRRIGGGKGYALTCPLITKADGTKFGKTEGGNIWLDANRTSPYVFFQYWLNTSDVDAEKYIKIFTLLDQETIAKLVSDHQEAPHLRLLQKNLAKEVTTAVHGSEAYENALKINSIESFKSKEDSRIEEFYHALILKYNAANGISKTDGSAFEYEADGTMKKDDATLMYTSKTQLAYLYSLYGYKNLYSLAHDMAEIERVQNSNQEIKDSSKYVLGVETTLARSVT